MAQPNDAGIGGGQLSAAERARRAELAQKLRDNAARYAAPKTPAKTPSATSSAAYDPLSSAPSTSSGTAGQPVARKVGATVAPAPEEIVRQRRPAPAPAAPPKPLIPTVAPRPSATSSAAYNPLSSANTGRRYTPPAAPEAAPPRLELPTRGYNFTDASYTGVTPQQRAREVDWAQMAAQVTAQENARRREQARQAAAAIPQPAKVQAKELPVLADPPAGWWTPPPDFSKPANVEAWTKQPWEQPGLPPFAPGVVQYVEDRNLVRTEPGGAAWVNFSRQADAERARAAEAEQYANLGLPTTAWEAEQYAQDPATVRGSLPGTYMPYSEEEVRAMQGRADWFNPFFAQGSRAADYLFYGTEKNVATTPVWGTERTDDQGNPIPDSYVSVGGGFGLMVDALWRAGQVATAGNLMAQQSLYAPNMAIVRSAEQQMAELVDAARTELPAEAEALRDVNIRIAQADTPSRPVQGPQEGQPAAAPPTLYDWVAEAKRNYGIVPIGPTTFDQTIRIAQRDPNYFSTVTIDGINKTIEDINRQAERDARAARYLASVRPMTYGEWSKEAPSFYDALEQIGVVNGQGIPAPEMATLIASSGAEAQTRVLENFEMKAKLPQIRELRDRMLWSGNEQGMALALSLNSLILRLESTPYSDLVDLETNIPIELLENVLLDPLNLLDIPFGKIASAHLAGKIADATTALRTVDNAGDMATLSRLFRDAYKPWLEGGRVGDLVFPANAPADLVKLLPTADELRGPGSWIGRQLARTPETQVHLAANNLWMALSNVLYGVDNADDAIRILRTLSDAPQEMITGVSGLTSPIFRTVADEDGIVRWGAGVISNKAFVKEMPIFQAGAARVIERMEKARDEAMQAARRAGTFYDGSRARVNPLELMVNLNTEWERAARQLYGIAPIDPPAGATKVAMRDLANGTAQVEWMDDADTVIRALPALPTAQARAQLTTLQNALTTAKENPLLKSVRVSAEIQRHIMSDMWLNLRPAHWVRNATAFTMALGVDGLYSFKSVPEMFAELGKKAIGGKMTHRLAEGSSGAGTLGEMTVQHWTRKGWPKYNPLAWMAEHGAKVWTGYGSILGRIPYGEQAGYLTGYNSAFNRLFNGDWATLTQKELLPLFASWGADPDLARAMIDKIVEVGRTGSKADVAQAARQMIRGSAQPFSVRNLGIADGVIPVDNHARIVGAVESLGRSVNGAAPRTAEQVEQEIRRVSQAIQAEFDQMRHRPGAVLAQAMPQPSTVTPLATEATDTMARLVDDAITDAQNAGITDPVLLATIEEDAQQYARRLVEGEAMGWEGVLDEMANAPDNPAGMVAAFDLLSQVYELKRMARQEVDELMAPVRAAQNADELDAAWTAKFAGTSEIYTRLADDLQAVFAASTDTLRRIAAGEEVPQQRDWWDVITRYLDFDARANLQDRGVEFGNMMQEDPAIVQKVIDANRAYVDSSYIQLYDVFRRYPSLDALDVLRMAQQQIDVEGAKAAAFLRTQRARLQHFDEAAGQVVGDLNKEEYYVIRNDTWRGVFDNQVIFNQAAARAIAAHALAMESPTKLTWTDDFFGGTFQLIGPAADDPVVSSISLTIDDLLERGAFDAATGKIADDYLAPRPLARQGRNANRWAITPMETDTQMQALAVVGVTERRSDGWYLLIRDPNAAEQAIRERGRFAWLGRNVETGEISVFGGPDPRAPIVAQQGSNARVPGAVMEDFNALVEGRPFPPGAAPGATPPTPPDSGPTLPPGGSGGGYPPEAPFTDTGKPGRAANAPTVPQEVLDAKAAQSNPDLWEQAVDEEIGKATPIEARPEDDIIPDGVEPQAWTDAKASVDARMQAAVAEAGIAQEFDIDFDALEEMPGGEALRGVLPPGGSGGAFPAQPFADTGRPGRVQPAPVTLPPVTAGTLNQLAAGAGIATAKADGTPTHRHLINAINKDAKTNGAGWSIPQGVKFNDWVRDNPQQAQQAAEWLAVRVENAAKLQPAAPKPAKTPKPKKAPAQPAPAAEPIPAPQIMEPAPPLPPVIQKRMGSEGNAYMEARRQLPPGGSGGGYPAQPVTDTGRPGRPYTPPAAPDAAPEAPAPAPQAPSPAGVERQPWEMTRAEFIDEVKRGRDIPLIGANPTPLSTLREAGDWATIERIAARNHDAATTMAFAEGRAVPANVLADYPELARLNAARAATVAPENVVTPALRQAQEPTEMAQQAAPAPSPIPPAQRVNFLSGQPLDRRTRAQDLLDARPTRNAPQTRREMVEDAYRQGVQAEQRQGLWYIGDRNVTTTEAEYLNYLHGSAGEYASGVGVAGVAPTTPAAAPTSMPNLQYLGKNADGEAIYLDAYGIRVRINKSGVGLRNVADDPNADVTFRTVDDLAQPPTTEASRLAGEVAEAPPSPATAPPASATPQAGVVAPEAPKAALNWKERAALRDQRQPNVGDRVASDLGNGTVIERNDYEFTVLMDDGNTRYHLTEDEHALRKEGTELPNYQPVIAPAPMPTPVAATPPPAPWHNASADDIRQEDAARAFYWSSSDPDGRGRRWRDAYVQHMDDLAAELAPYADTPEKQAILREELERYRARYLEFNKKLLGQESRTASSMITGPANFPVERNRKAMDALQNTYDEMREWSQKAQTAIERKLRPEIAPITGTGENALARLQAKLAELEAQQQRMVDANKIVRGKGDNAAKTAKLKALGLDDAEIQSRLVKGNVFGDFGYASFELTNNNAEIRRLKERITGIGKLSDTRSATTEWAFDGGRVVDNVEEDRVQVIFDVKLSDEDYEKMRKAGFVWSRKNQAFQRGRMNARQAVFQRTGVDISKPPVQAAAEAVTEAPPARAVPLPALEEEAQVLAGVEEAPIPQELASELAQLLNGQPVGMRLAGDGNAATRQRLMEALTGAKTPKSKAGVNALEKTLLEKLGIPTEGLTLNEQSQRLAARLAEIAQGAAGSPGAAFLEAPSAATFRPMMQRAFNLTDQQAEAVDMLARARANVWARQTGRSADEWYGANFAGIVQGGAVDDDALLQALDYNTPEFRQWFANASGYVKNEDGTPKRFYHGTGAGEFDAFDLARANDGALYGPGFYFTEDPDIAAGLRGAMLSDATDPDTAAFNSTGYAWMNPQWELTQPLTKRQMDSARRWFESTGRKEAAADIGARQVLNAGYRALNESPEAFARWLANYRPALRKRLKVERRLLSQPNALPVHLNVKRPIDMDWAPDALGADNLANQWLNSIERLRDGGESTAAAEQYFEKAFESLGGIGGRAYYGVRPNITSGAIYRASADVFGPYEARTILQRAGYDGITHMGGNNYGRAPHRVVIAFEPNQIKSVFNTRPTSDPRLLYQSAAEAQTRTPEFRQWFGDSKVVDEAGQPLRVYHGKGAEFEAFDLSKTGRTDSNWFAQGFYFSPNPDIAAQYANTGAPNMGVYHLSIQNPYMWRDAEGQSLRLMGEGASQAKRQELISKGYDGVFVHDMIIKSPIGLTDDQWTELVRYYRDVRGNNGTVGRDVVDRVIEQGISVDDFARYFGEDLANQFPQERVVSEIVAFYPNQIKTTWNTRPTSDPRLLRQQRNAMARGAAQFLDDGTAILRGLESPDVSTAVHEMAHVFRRDLATVAGLDAQAAEDMRILHNWVKLEPGQAWTREAEEQFARGFEAYLQSGKAPTPELQSAFARFKAWLAEIYRALRGEAGPQITPEMRGVYDRLLADAPAPAPATVAQPAVAPPPQAAPAATVRKSGWTDDNPPVNAQQVIDHPVVKWLADHAKRTDYPDGSITYYFKGNLPGQMYSKLSSDLFVAHRAKVAKYREPVFNFSAEPHVGYSIQTSQYKGQTQVVFVMNDERIPAAAAAARTTPAPAAAQSAVDVAQPAQAAPAAPAPRPAPAPVSERVELPPAQRGLVGSTVKGWSDPARQYDFQYEIVKLDDLIASNLDDGRINPRYPAELQPRDRTQQASQLQVAKMAGTLSPDELLTPTNAIDRGAPIVGPDNVIESGNGRVLAMRKAPYETYGKYTDALINRIRQKGKGFGQESWGITPEAFDAWDAETGRTRYVLIRRRVSDVDRVKFAQEANARVTLGMNQVEAGKTLANNLAAGDLHTLYPAPTGKLDDAFLLRENQDAVRRILQKIPRNEQAAYLDASGQLNPEGSKAIRSALFSIVFPDNQNIVRNYVDTLDTDMRNIGNGIERAIIDLAKVQLQNPDMGIGGEIAAAIDIVAQARAERMSVARWFDTPGFFEKPVALRPLAQAIDENIRSGKVIGRIFTNYTAEAIKHVPGQVSLLGDELRPDKIGMLNAAIDKLADADEGQLTLYGGFGAIDPRPAMQEIYQTMIRYWRKPRSPVMGDVALHEVTSLNDAEDRILAALPGMAQPRRNNFTAAQANALLDAVDKRLLPAFDDAVSRASYGAQKMADAAMLNYRDRRGIDASLALILPYHYFYTRGGATWLRRLARKPSVAAMYYDIQKAIETENKQAHVPARYKGTIPIWNYDGGQIRMANPLNTMLPFYMYMPDPYQTQEGDTDAERFWTALKNFAPGVMPVYDVAMAAVLDQIDPLPDGESRVARYTNLRNYVPLAGSFADYQMAQNATVTPTALGGDPYDPYRIKRTAGVMAQQGAFSDEMARYVIQLSVNLEAGGDPWANIPPEQSAAVRAAYIATVQQAGRDKLLMGGGAGYLLGANLYNFPYAERELQGAQDLWRYSGFGEQNPSGSAAQRRAVMEQYPALGAYMARSATPGAPYQPGQQAQANALYDRLDPLYAQQGAVEDQMIAASGFGVSGDALRAATAPMQAEIDATRAQYPNVPESTNRPASGSNPAEMAAWMLRQAVPKGGPAYPGKDAPKAELSAYYDARAAWEKEQLAGFQRNLSTMMAGNDPEQDAINFELYRLMAGKDAPTLLREYGSGYYDSPIRREYDTRNDVRQAATTAKFDAAESLILQEFGQAGLDVYKTYAVTEQAGREAYKAAHPELKALNFAAYNPDQYRQAVGLFGKDAILAWAKMPPSDGSEAASAARAAYNDANPGAYLMNAWMNGRPTPYNETIGPWAALPERWGMEYQYNFGKDFNEAAAKFGADIWQIVAGYKRGWSSAEKGAYFDKYPQLGDFFDWWNALLPDDGKSTGKSSGYSKGYSSYKKYYRRSYGRRSYGGYRRSYGGGGWGGGGYRQDEKAPWIDTVDPRWFDRSLWDTASELRRWEPARAGENLADAWRPARYWSD